MDEFDSWVAPVRIATRRSAPITPDDVGWDDEDPFFTSIWYDPGSTCGWSVFGIWPEAMYQAEVKILANVAAWSAGEFTGTEAQIVDQMMMLVTAWSDGTAVGWEDFILQKFLMSRDLLAPVRIFSRFEDRMYMADRSQQIRKPQSASLALRTVTDERLKAWGFWNALSGKEHARDAVRHNITWLRRVKEYHIEHGITGLETEECGVPEQSPNGEATEGGSNPGAANQNGVSKELVGA